MSSFSCAENWATSLRKSYRGGEGEAWVDGHPEHPALPRCPHPLHCGAASWEPHFCTLGSGRFSRWMTMWAW